MVECVILFDIDGTLVSNSSIEYDEQRRYSGAVHDLVGKQITIDPNRFAGMVDPQICKTLLTEVGLSQSEANALLPQMLSRMSEIYLDMAKNASLNKGVHELLPILTKSPRHVIGVLTGNLKAVAEAKLKICSIQQYFSEGFYSDRYDDRKLLVADAVKIAVSKYHLNRSADVTIIGDTPRDVAAAKDAHATSIGVASGVYSAARLSEAHPNFVFQNLEPTEQLLNSLGIP